MGYIIKIRLNEDGTIAGFIFDNTGVYKLKKPKLYRSYGISNPDICKQIKINESTPESLVIIKLSQ